MKKILSVVWGATIMVTLLNGQIKLTYQSHGFRPGDSHPFIFMKNSDEGPSGANVIWDFSQLEKTNKTLTSHMMEPINTPQAQAISNANFVLEEFGNYFYFNSNSSIMEQYGTVSGNVVTLYDKPLLKLKFPLSYGKKITGFYSGVQKSPTSNIPIKGSYEIYADAYGTLILPNQITIENVLRVKQTRTIEYENGSAITEVTYRWYAADVRYPILVIIKYVTNQQSYVAETAMYANAGSHKKAATQISSIDNTSTFEVYPNPFETQLTINFSLNKSSKINVDLYDISGKHLKTIVKQVKYPQGGNSIILNASELNLQNGSYYLKISTENESITKKIMKI